MHFLKLTCLFFIVVLGGCVAARLSNASETKDSQAVGLGGSVWSEYLGRLEGADLQQNCKPRFMPARGPEFRGSVILLHGFTACPQQYFELADKLTEGGLNVYLPLLPGHGYRMDYSPEDLKRAHEAVPLYPNGRSSYENFVDFLIRLGNSIEGPTMIGGLSAGGLLATQVLQRPYHGFSKAVIMVPFYALTDRPAFLLQNLHRVSSVSKFLGSGGQLIANIIEKGIFKKEVSWGEACEKDRDGRAGYCRFLTGHVALLQVMGEETQKKQLQGTLSALMIGVEGDPAVSTPAMERFADVNGFPYSGQGPKVACVFEEGVNHSLLSQYDDPLEVKFWKEPLEQSLVDFLVKDLPMPVGQSEKGQYPFCEPGST